MPDAGPCYTYTYPDGAGQKCWSVFDQLSAALAHCLICLQYGRVRPIGIRRGREVLYWSLDLVGLWMQYREQLDAGEEWPVVVALAALCGDPPPERLGDSGLYQMD